MKFVVKLATDLASMTSSIMHRVGLLFVCIFAILSFAYLRGDLPGEVRVNFTKLVTGSGMPYLWLGLLTIWLCSSAIVWGVKTKAFWLQREQHKRELALSGRRLRSWWAKLTGDSREYHESLLGE